MKVDQVLDTYDARYATVYNDTFLHDSWTKRSVEFQLELLKKFLENAKNWLDVACGTGYVLSQFPHVDRAGLDISPAMLDLARRANPGVTFTQRDFRDPFPPWNDKWDLVSCMWWAYCFSESMAETQQLVTHLADWTSFGGTCFLPLCNPQKFDSHNIRIPYIDPRVPGRCMITAITWAWIQENGKRHDNMLTPQVDHMIAMFRQHFHDVEVVEGPMQEIGEGWRIQDVLVAKNKKRERIIGDLYEAVDGDAAGEREWWFSTAGGTIAGLTYPSRNLRHVRVAIARRSSDDPSTVSAQKIGYRVETNQRYRVGFSARSDTSRTIAVGVSMGAHPWNRLGLNQQVTTGPTWKNFVLDFKATGTHDRARIHFDLGGSESPVELSDVTVTGFS